MSTRSAIARPVPSEDGKIKFVGVYHHWDGYPQGLGATLFELYNGFFKRDLDAMLKTLIDDHPAGWSTINGKDLSLAPGFHDRINTNGTCVCGQPEQDHLCQTHGINGHLQAAITAYPCNAGKPWGTYGHHLGHLYEPDEETKAQVAAIERIPECYCHGSRSEEAHEVNETNASGSGCEYVYLLRQTPDGAMMMILSSYTEVNGVPAKMIGMFGMGDPDATWKPIAVVGLDAVQAPDWERVGEEAVA